MSELLIELFSEEIPARMQSRASEDLKRLMLDGLKAASLSVGEAKAFATPRRLTLVVEGVPERSPDIADERKGPRVGAPEGAMQGFLKASGLTSLEQAEIVKDAKKGDFYVARINKPGRAAGEIIAELLPAVIHKFPWPKSMRWGSGKLRWVRPLHSIICLLGGKVVPFEIEGVHSGNHTEGHRFLGPGKFEVKDFADYQTKLKARKVLLDPLTRAAQIGEAARQTAASYKLKLIEDAALTDENAGLTEWPTVLMGTFDKEFLEVPGEVLTTAMKAHQKCFSLKNAKSGKLANHFLLVTNLQAKDEGAAIIAGNEKVIRARLSDARFFWEQDKKKKLEPMHFELKGITFHEKLGTQWERMERITELARQIAPMVDAEPDLAGRAAQLSKADLVSGMVGEFPELQGLMGRYYAEAEHMAPKIAAAIEEHYKPRGAGDSVPTAPVSIAVALADKLDTLVGFWAINEKPTGSGDPYQLRRAALGVIRIVLENDLRVRLIPIAVSQAQLLRAQGVDLSLWDGVADLEGDFIDGGREIKSTKPKSSGEIELAVNLLSFFADRLRVYLKDKGARHDLVDAVFSLGGQDDLALIVKRVNALDAFLKTEDGRVLLAGVKRATNILRIEEKKDKKSYDGPVEPALLELGAEKGLYDAIVRVSREASNAIDMESFAGAMSAISELRAPVDDFFETVTVNDDNPKLRVNRLNLLNQIRAATLKVADFSKVEG